MRSNICWCSGGLEFTFWSGEVVRAFEQVKISRESSYLTQTLHTDASVIHLVE